MDLGARGRFGRKWAESLVHPRFLACLRQVEVRGLDDAVAGAAHQVGRLVVGKQEQDVGTTHTSYRSVARRAPTVEPAATTATTGRYRRHRRRLACGWRKISTNPAFGSGTSVLLLLLCARCQRRKEAGRGAPARLPARARRSTKRSTSNPPMSMGKLSHHFTGAG